MPLPSKPQLKINALKRLVKEYEEYKNEERELEARIKGIDGESPDEYELQNTKRVLEETKKVRTHVAQSIHTHATEVSKLTGLKPEEDAQAKEALDSAKKIGK